jgi:hypothetical protein
MDLETLVAAMQAANYAFQSSNYKLILTPGTREKVAQIIF